MELFAHTILDSEGHKRTIYLEKGIYANTAENRKLGRVGGHYGGTGKKELSTKEKIVNATANLKKLKEAWGDSKTAQAKEQISRLETHIDQLKKQGKKDTSLKKKHADRVTVKEGGEYKSYARKDAKKLGHKTHIITDSKGKKRVVSINKSRLSLSNPAQNYG